METEADDSRSTLERCEDLLNQWRAERNSSTFDPVPLLTGLSDLLEEQINIFFSTDPDPFDDRHPLRTDSSCDLGKILRLLSSHESFIERITFVYLVSSSDPSNRLVVAALRLLCAMRFGVTLSYSLDEEDPTIQALYRLASSDHEPTNGYALFLLGSVLDNTELLYSTRQKNMQLIPVVMQRLTIYTEKLNEEVAIDRPNIQNLGMNSLLGSFHLSEPTIEMKIRLSIAFLLSVAEYQDLMPCMFDRGILNLIYTWVSPEMAARDIRLTFSALRLLGNLMCHRCVYLEFVDHGGLQAVLGVPRPSVAATAVGIILYYTSYFEDAMERVCQLPEPVLVEMIRYALWLVECSHPSARCYALFFINLVLCYGVTFRLFAAQNGLVYLFNAICVLPLRLTEDNPPSVKDTTSWHVVRASLSAIRRFLEVSLLLWIDELDPSLANIFDEPPRSVAAAGYRPITYTQEQMSRLTVLVISRIRPEYTWAPTKQLHECGAIAVLYRIIARNVYSHNSWPCRNECTRLAVDILNMMSFTYDLADEIASTDVYSFPTSLNSAAATFLSMTPEFNGEDGSGGSPFSGSADVTVHLPSPDATGAENSRENRREFITQMLDLVEQFTSNNATVADARRFRRARDHSTGEESESNEAADGNPVNEGGIDERVNGLHMLFSISREDDGWDIAVHKAILAFVSTLVYRPIADHEHPDNPIPASRVISHLQPTTTSSSTALTTNISMQQSHGATGRLNHNGVTSPSFKTPHRLSSGCSYNRSNRKRKLEDLPSVSSAHSPPPSDVNRHPPTDSDNGARSMSFPSTISESNIPPSLEHSKSLRLLHRQAHLWNIVRRQHGIMALLIHLECKQPISDADNVRTLACRGLVGLARSEEVRSMLAKLPLFTKALLQLLMKEPVLPDRLTEHAEFCRYATLLIRLVVGNLSDGVLSGDMSLDRVRRAEIVAKTRIQWDQEELLDLIFRHLVSKGLHQSAETLQREANLKVVPNTPVQLPLYDDFSRPPGETPPYRSSSDLSPTIIPVPNTSDFSKPAIDSIPEAPGAAGDVFTDVVPPTPSLKLTKVRPTQTPVQTPKAYRDRFERPTIQNIYLKPISNQPAPEMTLSKVVESFLLHQHAQCPHPVSMCPKFSLYHPHRCPEPRPNKQTNCLTRILAREALFASPKLRPSKRDDRHFLHRRFLSTAIIREADDDLLTSCCFPKVDEGLFLGTTSGAIAWVNIEENSLPIELSHVQSSTIRRMEHTHNGERLLVCSEWGEPATIVLNLRSGGSTNPNCPWEAISDDYVFRVSEARYAEFCKTGIQDRLVATHGKMAKVLDLTTGSRIADLFSAAKQSGYMLNKATFSPCDQLVLNDGVVWDLRCTGTYPTNAGYQSHHSGTSSSHRPVHKFDKLQNLVSGVFHPNGLEIIIGSAVWDVRTWKLLHTVQALDRLEIQFNATNDVIYAGNFGWDDDEYAELGSRRLVTQNMFRTLDAIDYSLIASVDVRHRIEQLSLDTMGQSLALVEKIGENNGSDPITQCRIYHVGRKRAGREPDEDEDAREEEDDDDDDDDENDEDDDELLNAETADELAQILDTSDSDSSSDDSTSSTYTSEWEGSAVDSPAPVRRSRRLQARVNGESAENQERDVGEAHSNHDDADANDDSSWETMEEEEVSDTSSLAEN